MTITLMLFMLLLSGCAGERAPSTDLSKALSMSEVQYGAIIDAGSSKSEIAIFKWRRSEQILPTLRGQYRRSVNASWQNSEMKPHVFKLVSVSSN